MKKIPHLQPLAFQVLSALLLCCAPILIRAQSTCNVLSISIANEGWVACDQVTTRISVCNDSTFAQSFGFVEVWLPESLTFVSAVPAPSTVSGSVYSFALGNLQPNECQNIELVTAVDCDLEEGRSICLHAKALVNENCVDTSWTGAILNLEGYCEGNNAKFALSNDGAGLPANTLEYLIIEDHLLKIGPTPLPAVDSTTSSTPSLVIDAGDPAGKTVTLSIPPIPGYPDPRPLVASVEGCGTGPVQTGYVAQYAQNSGIRWADYCDTVRTALGGVHKSAFPVGYSTSHFIEKNTRLHYRIAFQNESNTTVNTVVIRDTLSAHLDLARFQIGAAKHPFAVTLVGQVLTVQFNNLQLPPASVNEPASRGFFSFHIWPKADAPLGTVIPNQAFVELGNSPDKIASGTVFHTLGSNFILSSSVYAPSPQRFSVDVQPNPMHTFAQFRLGGDGLELPIQLAIFDLWGRLHWVTESSGPVINIQREDLPSGTYLYRCTDAAGGVVAGRLVVR